MRNVPDITKSVGVGTEITLFELGHPSYLPSKLSHPSKTSFIWLFLSDTCHRVLVKVQILIHFFGGKRPEGLHSEQVLLVLLVECVTTWIVEAKGRVWRNGKSVRWPGKALTCLHPLVLVSSLLWASGFSLVTWEVD